MHGCVLINFFAVCSVNTVGCFRALVGDLMNLLRSKQSICTKTWNVYVLLPTTSIHVIGFWRGSGYLRKEGLV